VARENTRADRRRSLHAQAPAHWAGAVAVAATGTAATAGVAAPGAAGKGRGERGCGSGLLKWLMGKCEELQGMLRLSHVEPTSWPFNCKSVGTNGKDATFHSRKRFRAMARFVEGGVDTFWSSSFVAWSRFFVRVTPTRSCFFLHEHFENVP